MNAQQSTGGPPTAASGRIAVPEHLLPKLRKAAADQLTLAAKQVTDSDLNSVVEWEQFDAERSLVAEHLTMYAEVQANAADPSLGMRREDVRTLAAAAANMLAWSLEDAPTRAQDLALVDGLIDDIRTVRELAELARAAGSED